MKFIQGSILLRLISIAAGAVVLGGYFIQIPWLETVRSLLLEWAIVLGGFLLIGGVLGLARIHWHRLKTDPRNRLSSLTLLASTLATFFFLIWDNPSHDWAIRILNGVFLPIETSLVALLAIILLASAVRLAFSRRGGMTIVFLSSAGVYLISASPETVTHLPEPVSNAAHTITNLAASAGVRGLLIGIALGAVLVGMRFWLGIDHPHDG